MKRKKRKTATVIILSLVLLMVIYCTPGKEIKEVNRDIVATHLAKPSGSQAFETDLKSYRREVDALIATNDSLMIVFKMSMKNASKETNPYYKMQIADLGKRSVEMKTRMDEFKWNGNVDWLAFKKEFSNDMTELGEAFRHLSVKSTGPHISRVY